MTTFHLPPPLGKLCQTAIFIVQPNTASVFLDTSSHSLPYFFQRNRRTRSLDAERPLNLDWRFNAGLRRQTASVASRRLNSGVATLRKHFGVIGPGFEKPG
jgi:hypothetical protein